MFVFDYKTFEQKDEILQSHPHIRIHSDSASKSRVIVKKYQCDDFDYLLQTQKECVLRFHLDHPSLVPIQGYSIQDDGDDLNVYTKMPLIGAGLNLRKMIDDHFDINQSIQGSDIIKIMYSLACGLDYLHSKRILHQNLKPSNVILDEKKNAKLSDMRLSILIPEEEELKPIMIDHKSFGDYHAPELHGKIRESARDDLFKTDVWSLGVLISELCLLERNIMSKFIQSRDESIIQSILARIEQKYSPHLVKIIKDMLCIEVTQRATINEILKEIKEKFDHLLDKQIEVSHQSEIDHLSKNEQSQNTSTVSLDLIREKEKPDLSSKEEKQRETLYFQQMIEHIQEKCKELQISQTEKDILSIKSAIPEKIHDSHIENIINALQSRMQEFDLKSPNGFDLELSRCENITDKSLTSVAAGLAKCLDSLSFLKIDLWGCSSLTDSGIGELSLNISQSLQNLEELNLSFYECKKVSDEGMKHLGDNLSGNLSQLQKLSLNFNWCYEITDEGINYLTKSLCKKHLNLSYLELYLSKCSSITSKGFAEIGLQISIHLLNLKHLSFDFSICENISDDTILNIGSILLTKLKDLQEFHLDLTRCVQITDQGLQNLYHRINRSYISLEKFSLNLTKCDKITDEGVKVLMTEFSPKLAYLKQLNINFHSCSKLTANSLFSIASSLDRDFRNLESITLGFHWCFNLNEKGLESLCKVLMKMPKLTDIKLNFQGCPKISEKSKLSCKKLLSSKFEVSLK